MINKSSFIAQNIKVIFRLLNLLADKFLKTNFFVCFFLNFLSKSKQQYFTL